MAAGADVAMDLAGMESRSLSGAGYPIEGNRRLVHTLERSLKPQVVRERQEPELAGGPLPGAVWLHQYFLSSRSLQAT